MRFYVYCIYKLWFPFMGGLPVLVTGQVGVIRNIWLSECTSQISFFIAMNQSKQKRILTKRDVGACEWRSVHLFDCKAGKKMKLKWTIPYLLFGSTMFCGTGVSMTAPTATTVSRPSVFADDVRGVALSYRSIIPYDCIFERSVNEFYLDD